MTKPSIFVQAIDLKLADRLIKDNTLFLLLRKPESLARCINPAS
jgi:hypothetical protein